MGEEALNKDVIRSESAISKGISILLEWKKDDWKKVKDILIILVGHKKDYLNLEAMLKKSM